MVAKRSGCKESRLTLRRVTPACLSGPASFFRRVALVLSDRSSRPGNCARRAANSGSLPRDNGSPPVRRMRRTPSSVKARMTRSISSKLSQSAGSSKSWNPFGRQYEQRKSQRSVTDTRTYSMCRRKGSIRRSFMGGSFTQCGVGVHETHGFRRGRLRHRLMSACLTRAAPAIRRAIQPESVCWLARGRGGQLLCCLQKMEEQA